MKKVLKIFAIFIITIILCSCKNKNVDDTTSMTIDDTIGTMSSFNTAIEDFCNNNNNYSLVMYTVDITNGYGKAYALYAENGVTILNYPNYEALANFSIHFEGNSSDSKIMDLLYTFPLIYDESEENLKVEYELYKSLIKSVLPSVTDDKFNVILDYFKCKDFEQLYSIYNEKETLNFRIINMEENNNNYLSTLFLKDSKRFTLEYHDELFEENIDEDDFE